MWHNKKVLIGAALAITMVAVTITGAAYAQAAGQPAAAGNSLMTRVATILGIPQQTLENAFAQARSDMQKEALDARLKGLVDQGKLTQAQADQYKAWILARPNLPASSGLAGGPGMKAPGIGRGEFGGPKAGFGGPAGQGRQGPPPSPGAPKASPTPGK